ncbi:hypothetical protein BH11PAT2_BH11PAT2_03150 [soil metagenome]
MSAENPPRNEIRKERTVENPEDLSAREVSKSEMADERRTLAAEIIQERKERRDKIATLRVRTSLFKNTLEHSGQPESGLEEGEALEDVRAEEANLLTGSIQSFLSDKHNDFNNKVESVSDLADGISQLVDTDSTLSLIREKIAAHYEDAMIKGRSRVEQTILRNKAFFVHVMLESSPTEQPNDSDISFEDKLDLILSLEPSLATSSVIPGTDEAGRVSGVWGKGDSGGVLIAGGRISAASETDMGSFASDIQSRDSFVEEGKSLTEIDSVVQSPKRSKIEGTGVGGHNEFVVDAPEVLGYFKPGFIDGNGTFLVGTSDMHTQTGAETILQIADRYRERLNYISSKGLPFYVMTPDRHFFEVHKVKDDGSLEVGEELTPEQAAKSPAGLQPEMRKEIGRKLLNTNLVQGEEARTAIGTVIENIH